MTKVLFDSVKSVAGGADIDYVSADGKRKARVWFECGDWNVFVMPLGLGAPLSGRAYTNKADAVAYANEWCGHGGAE